MTHWQLIRHFFADTWYGQAIFIVVYFWVLGWFMKKQEEHEALIRRIRDQERRGR